jgi:hypothetical protein
VAARIALAWELGLSIGHATAVARLGARLRERGHHVGLFLRDLAPLRFLPEAAALDVAQAPQPTMEGLWGGPPTSYAAIMKGCGYGSAESTRAMLSAWRDQLAAWKPHLVLTDFAPTALLAARTLGVRRATYGNGFFTPPRVTPLPQFRIEQRQDPAHLAQLDAQVLGHVNEALAACGAAPLERLAQQFEADEDFLCTFPELDHYGGRPVSAWWGPRFSVEAGRAIDWPAGPNKRVLVYVQPHLAVLDELLTTLRARNHSVVAFIPGLDDARRTAFAGPRMRLPEGLVRLDRLLPECDLVICHGGDIASGAIASGIPQLIFPGHYEQHLTALRIEQLGAGLAMRAPAPVGPLLDRVLNDAMFHYHARTFAARYPGWSPAEQRRRVMARIEQIVAA